ncbi:Aldehyde reductase 1 [Aspergillus niger]|uniref:Aldehyde reductase 1 n=1 Tax=Aspergillus niger TaxID=5061 RepID=A0A254UEB2_ASPNG|nr:hypothetical protein CBS147345_10856 [Aspergillus niger]TPR04321.1 Aldehyde reductase 1 [Aspergillus niger]SPB51171.1 unnamed protein product [Aspergillus niger]
MPSACPKSSDEWIKAARAYNLNGNTLCTWPNLLSGSKVSKEQFLLYRIVCPERKKPRELDLTWFGVPHNTIADAQEMLNQSDAYRHYLHNIQNGDWANPALGVFGPALRLQAEIWKGWNSTRVDATDEDTVKSALIELLNVLTSTSTDGSCWWRTYNRRLTYQANGNSYTAVTDGQLEDQQSQCINLPIECKDFLRDRRLSKVTMQEASQLVALVNQVPMACTGKCHPV